MPRNLVVLGSTGSIGRQTLDVAREMPERIRIFGLAAHSSADRLRAQVEEFGPKMTCLVQGDADLVGAKSLRGDEGLIEMVQRPEVDLVVVGTTGKAGLGPTIAALEAGKLVALANKETLVMAGPVIREVLARGRGSLVPIDSEHSAIWQCLQGEPAGAVERLTLTASGGALRDLPLEALERVTPEQALRHPTWRMGPKITVDSANLMNKGLEVIEAQWLFDLSIDRVNVVMHPQSIVHSLVTFTDGSMKAQLGLPDMRLPIQYALSHPDRWPTSLPRADLAAIGALTFAKVDYDRYPALRLALDAAQRGNTYPAVLSAADEIAVEEFLNGALSFTDIPRIIDGVLDAHRAGPELSLDTILLADSWARAEAARLIRSGGSVRA